MTRKDLDHLKWMYERMVEVHHENINVDYMLKFKEILKQEDFSQSAERLNENSRYGKFGGITWNLESTKSKTISF